MKKTLAILKKQQQLNLTDKLMLTGILPFDKRRRTVEELIKKSPIYLWKLIHQKHSNVSLTRDAYYVLKKAVNKKRPDLVEKVNKQHDQSKAQRVASKEFRNGNLGNESSRFKLINKTKILKY